MFNTNQDNAMLEQNRPVSQFASLENIYLINWLIYRVKKNEGNGGQTDKQTDRRTDAGDDN